MARFVAHCEFYAQDIENATLVIRVLSLSFFSERKPVLPYFVFCLIIVKSLQLRKRRQIVKPRKYCLVRVIGFFFFLRMFSLIFLSLTGWEFHVNFLRL